MRPDSVIATWVNEDRTRGFQLQADGTLVEVVRSSPSDVWSPPADPISLARRVESFGEYLDGLSLLYG